MRFVGALLISVSWIVLLITGLGGLAAGWLYYGYSKLECHPMFAKLDAACSFLSTWASEHVMIAGRALMPYSRVLTSEQDILLLSTLCAVGSALLIQVVHRVLVRRRKRRLGVFADVKGFRPIDLSVDP
jgi:hypothetical protein